MYGSYKVMMVVLRKLPEEMKEITNYHAASPLASGEKKSLRHGDIVHLVSGR